MKTGIAAAAPCVPTQNSSWVAPLWQPRPQTPRAQPGPAQQTSLLPLRSAMRTCAALMEEAGQMLAINGFALLVHNVLMWPEPLTQQHLQPLLQQLGNAMQRCVIQQLVDGRWLVGIGSVVVVPSVPSRQRVRQAIPQAS